MTSSRPNAKALRILIPSLWLLVLSLLVQVILAHQEKLNRIRHLESEVKSLRSIVGVPRDSLQASRNAGESGSDQHSQVQKEAETASELPLGVQSKTANPETIEAVTTSLQPSDNGWAWYRASQSQKQVFCDKSARVLSGYSADYIYEFLNSTFDGTVPELMSEDIAHVIGMMQAMNSQ